MVIETIVIRVERIQNYHEAYIKLQRAGPTSINRNSDMITLRGSRVDIMFCTKGLKVLLTMINIEKASGPVERLQAISSRRAAKNTE
jgi:hypothetical protein